MAEETLMGKIEWPRRRARAGVVKTPDGWHWFVEREAEGEATTHLDALGDLTGYLVRTGSISTARRLLAEVRDRPIPGGSANNCASG